MFHTIIRQSVAICTKTKKKTCSWISAKLAINSYGFSKQHKDSKVGN